MAVYLVFYRREEFVTRGRHEMRPWKAMELHSKDAVDRQVRRLRRQGYEVRWQGP